MGWLLSWLDPVAVGIQDDAFVVAVAGPAGTVQDWIAIGAQPGGQFVYCCLRANRHGQVNVAGELDDRIILRGRDVGSSHQFQPGPGVEAQKIELKLFGRVDVFRPSLGVKIGLIELFQPFQVLGPEGDVFNPHGPVPWVGNVIRLEVSQRHPIPGDDSFGDQAAMTALDIGADAQQDDRLVRQ